MAIRLFRRRRRLLKNLGIFGIILVIVAVYKTTKDKSLIQKRNTLNHNQDANLSEEVIKRRVESVKRRCSPSKDIHHNGADLQVSDLVESLEFKLEENVKINVAPLPFTNELTVYLVAHSHCDPGWLETYTKYYKTEVKPLLTNLYQWAMDHQDFKYIYAEVSFFKLWWEDQTKKVRDDMGRLAREGRFEFVQGGWVQADEANSHYFALLNQMLDGHEWLKKNLPDARPRTGWAIDPFGLSPVMAQVNKMFGLDAMHIQRVHYTLKKHLAENRKLEFRWRQSWDSDEDTDILTHMGPFNGYCDSDTCGPDTNVCVQYDYSKMDFLTERPPIVFITPENVKERSLLILDQWRKKAALHASNAVFIELGCDFSYRFINHLETVYSNYTMIREYINNNPELNTQVKWGTLSDYFDHIKKSNVKFPSLSGDFFTYADRSDQYWSGYYTSRPFYKNLDRVLESSLRRTEILFSFYRAKEGVKELTDVRNTLSLFQHHDAITGTAKKNVVLDYGQMLSKAVSKCDELSITAIRQIMYNLGIDGKDFHSTRSIGGLTRYSKYRILIDPADIVIANTIARKTSAAQVIAVQSNLNFTVVSSGGEIVPQQFEPSIEYGRIVRNSEFIVFWTELPSVYISINKFKLIHSEESAKKQERRTEVTLYNTDTLYGKTLMSLQLAFEVTMKIQRDECEDIDIGGDKLVITLDCLTGRLKNIQKEGINVAIEQEVLLYKSDRSGAYLFLPSGDPSQILLESSRPEFIVIKGPIRDKAVVTLKFLSGSTLVLTYIVYHHPGLEGQFVELKMMSDLKDYGDLAIRFKTDIKSGDSIFTDLNGHTIQQHKFKRKLLTQGNFFPMPSTAFIQDSSTRFSLLGSEPHGVASLAEGWIEVVLDRRTLQDDHKGMGEKVDDNVPTPANLRILVEARSETPTQSELYMVEYPSLVSHMTLQSLLHPPFLLSATLAENSSPHQHQVFS
ncbi:alpha-mannosidase 2x-like [Bolinopsis microptera]|uniref:alpha-mannosidase 2x-like n=1 Tax=Bolinopsis microptera TaxID=2820187 RepID=UPI00307A4A89